MNRRLGWRNMLTGGVGHTLSSPPGFLNPSRGRGFNTKIFYSPPVRPKSSGYRVTPPGKSCAKGFSPGTEIRDSIHDSTCPFIFLPTHVRLMIAGQTRGSVDV